MSQPYLNRTDLQYKLESKLARSLTDSTHQWGPDQNLAITNSVCLLVLLTGILGSEPAYIRVEPLPSVNETSVAIVELLPPPAETSPKEQTQEPNKEKSAELPEVTIVAPEAPNIQFSIPPLGRLAAPTELLKTAPITEFEKRESVQPGLPERTPGNGGNRPKPPYPESARAQGQQGSVTLRMTMDAAGNVCAIVVSRSSGFPILDRSALDYVKRHWTVTPDQGNRVYEATIDYRLQSTQNRVIR